MITRRDEYTGVPEQLSRHVDKFYFEDEYSSLEDNSLLDNWNPSKSTSLQESAKDRNYPKNAIPNKAVRKEKLTKES